MAVVFFLANHTVLREVLSRTKKIVPVRYSKTRAQIYRTRSVPVVIHGNLYPERSRLLTVHVLSDKSDYCYQTPVVLVKFGAWFRPISKVRKTAWEGERFDGVKRRERMPV